MLVAVVAAATAGAAAASRGALVARAVAPAAARRAGGDSHPWGVRPSFHKDAFIPTYDGVYYSPLLLNEVVG